MKYICLVYSAKESVNQPVCVRCPSQTPSHFECDAYANRLLDSGNLLTRETLGPHHSATTLQVRNGKLAVIDHPLTSPDAHFTEFYLLQARDLNQAILLAEGIPSARVSIIEIHPIRELQS